MVAPSPVSALLHAATMVAAGPFLLIQLEPLYAGSQAGLIALTWVGGLTLVLAGLMALCARDAKRVLAYSTISQLSVPILGAAVFASGPSLYHIVAHAWFKAPLFLAVGYLAAVASHHGGGNVHVTQHSGDEHDTDDHTLLTRLAGSARRHPLVLIALVLAGLALAGVAFTGGFFGKEQVLLALQSRASQVYQGDITFGSAYPAVAQAWRIGAFLMLLSLPITAAYSARLIGILILGKTESVEPERPAVKQPLASLGLITLAAFVGCIVLSIAFGSFQAVFSRDDQPWRWIKPEPAGLIIDLLLVAAAITLAWLFNLARPRAAAVLMRGTLGKLARFFDNGMYLRELWTGLFGRGGTIIAALADRSERDVIARVVEETGRDGRRLAHASSWFDRHVVDGLRYWGAEIWWVVRRLHQRWLQNGSIQHYMFVILLSATVLCLIVIRPLAKAFGEIIGRM
jgi:NADH-quinone oxidoreductase subunit L